MERNNKCFCCGKSIKVYDTNCPYCGAILQTIEIDAPKNPNTQKFILRDGTQVETNKCYLIGLYITYGALLLLLGTLLSKPEDLGEFIGGFIVLGIGALLMLIGCIREHKGKVVVRRQNDIERQLNPNYRTKEDDEDLLDKINRKLGITYKKRNRFEPVEEKLYQLKMYYEQGLISRDEYEKAKAKLLNID